ncbi:DUF4238 domain-containing protein [Mesorhizobium sp. M0317]|uniref:DUF4238 domain-containing protein n=1 Tax=Mesorhizobium sp. M0317 TaxID=2956935 RepID=UPI0033367B05
MSASYFLSMSKPSKPSRKHHYVTQAQLRHFARDKGRTQICVFDKTTGQSFTSSILNAGSENGFNTIIDDGGRLNFEAMFDKVDTAGAAIVAQIAERRSLAWMREEQVLSLADLGTVQLFRTKLARETPGVLAEEMRDLLDKLGADLNHPQLAPPTEADAKRGTMEAFVKRASHRDSFLRLMPGLVEPAGSARFLISDHPVVFSNPFPYGDHALQAQGILVHLPLSPSLLLTWHCPTIVARLDHLLSTDGSEHAALRAYGWGLASGEPVTISDKEVERYNFVQVTQSRRFLFSHTADFSGVGDRLAAKPGTVQRDALVHLGRMGEGPPPRRHMPEGWNMVVHGPRDHCLLHLEEIDADGEGITARTSDLALLNAAARDVRLDYVELYNGPRQQRHLGHVKLEKLANRGAGWFRAVHFDDSLRALDRQIREASGKNEG